MRNRRPVGNAGMTPAVRQDDSAGKRGSGRSTYSSVARYSISNAMPFVDDRMVVGADGRRRYRTKTTVNPSTGSTVSRKINPPRPYTGPGASHASRHSQRVGAARWRRMGS